MISCLMGMMLWLQKDNNPEAVSKSGLTMQPHTSIPMLIGRRMKLPVYLLCISLSSSVKLSLPRQRYGFCFTRGKAEGYKGTRIDIGNS